MATVEEFTNPHLGTYTPPPPAGPGVCDVCHGVPNAGYVRCWSCDQSTESVSHPVELLVPISFYRVGEQLHTVLKDYKRSPDERVTATRSPRSSIGSSETTRVASKPRPARRGTR